MLPEPVPPGILRIVGSQGSPYSRKLVAVLRYRRLAYRWINRHGPDDKDLPIAPGPDLLPNIIFDGNEAMADTTPIIKRLEHDFKGRSVYPSHKGLAFLNLLLEDYADEWHSKYMFHYRWWFQPDTLNAGKIMPLIANHTMPESEYRKVEAYFVQRQTKRVAAVTGSNDVTAPVIEESFKSLVTKLNDHFAAGKRFLFGSRPSSADFAFYGQLTQLAHFDPTPSAVVQELAPRVSGYTFFLEDMSGSEVTNADWDVTVSPSLKAIITEAGRFYAPFMVANAAAVARGDKEVQTTLDGRPFVANSFAYHAKCLRWLKDDYSSLSPDDRAFVDRSLAGTGVEVMFADALQSNRPRSRL